MPEFYTRRTGNTVPSAIQYAAPIIELGQRMKDRKRQEAEDEIKKGYEAENRNIAAEIREFEKQRMLNSDTVAKEERAYRKIRDVNSDTWRQSQADTANTRWNTEQTQQNDRAKADDAYKNAMLTLQTKMAEAKTNPELTALYKDLENVSTSYYGAVKEGNMEGANILAPQVLAGKERIKEYTTRKNDPYMGLKENTQKIETGINEGWKERGQIPSEIKAKGVSGKTVVRTGKDKSGKQVIQYSDGTIEYAN
jgi:hypothetical protein